MLVDWEVAGRGGWVAEEEEEEAEAELAVEWPLDESCLLSSTDDGFPLNKPDVNELDLDSDELPTVGGECEENAPPLNELTAGTVSVVIGMC